jgi:outer membrane protein assembly factor BamD
MVRNSLFLFSIIAFIMLVSCSKYQKMLKSTDNELKYEKAVEFYEKGDYYRALQLFDGLIPVFRGTNKAEKLYFYYAYCYYNEHDNVMASYYFGRFAQSFPNSASVEEAIFMAAYCKYLDSPRFSLDQTITKEAINELQIFINRYPYSERAKQATLLLDELRYKLQLKDYNIANMYYKMEDFQAAIVSYENMLKAYPDTDFKEEILYRIIKSYYNYAMKSIPEKKKERYESAVKAYFDFISLYPESKYFKEVQTMRDKVVKELKNFEQQQIQ